MAHRGPELFKGRGRRCPTAGREAVLWATEDALQKVWFSPRNNLLPVISQRRPAVKLDTPRAPWWALRRERADLYVSSTRGLSLRVGSAASAGLLTPLGESASTPCCGRAEMWRFLPWTRLVSSQFIDAGYRMSRGN